MDEQTTTDAATQAQAPTTAQPDEQPAEAVQPTDSEPTTTNDEQGEPAEPDAPSDDAQPDNSAEEDLADYWSKKGIDITTPEGQRAAAKSYREAEKAMHQSKQRSSELEKQLQSTPFEQVSDDPTAQQALETASSVKLELQVERWKNQHNITPQQDEAIGQYLTDNPNKAYMLKNGYLSLDDVAAMSGALKEDTEAIRSQGSRETLEKLANKQVASSVPASAMTSTAPAPLTAANAEAWWDSLGPAGRADPANQAKLDAVLGS